MSDVTHIGPYELDSIITGDARELAKVIPRNSIDLIFTDPVYDRIGDYDWLADFAYWALKPEGWLLAYYGIGFLPQTVAALSSYLTYEWHHVCYMPTLNARGAYRTFSNYRGLLRYRKGDAKPFGDARDLLTDGFDAKNNGHAWAKNLDVVANWMRAYSPDEAVVFDPFGGGGTMCAAAKITHRHYLAFEIDPDTAERARQRVLTTQAPLVFPEPEQLAMDV